MRGNSSNSASGSGRPAAAPTANGRLGVSGAMQSSSTSKIDSPAKMVFGLSSRTNKLKHDEYAEKRGAANHLLSRAVTQDRVNNTAIMSENGLPVDLDKADKSIKATNSKQTNRKYGIHSGQDDNFIAQPYKAQSSPMKANNLTTTTTTDNSSPALVEPVRKNRATSPAAIKNIKQRSKSPEKSSETSGSKRRVGVVAAPSLVKNTNATTTTKSEPDKLASGANDFSNNKEELEDKPKKMQFNIPPPPQVNSSSSRKGSVVSYAKSRIYDKPAKQHLSNPQQFGAHPLNKSNHQIGLMLTDSHAVIPESILSGFKPPKQVNVSKAREKWEGGEPFAKCKSRQRLAAQRAGKKLQLHGTWSMTSVVATQQLQLQQALANSNSPVRSNLERSDPSVKILTRGSVLERVQQFEKAPAGSDGGLSNSDLDEILVEQDINIPIVSSTESPLIVTNVSTSKQAQYKTRVSSIQNATATSNSVGDLQQTAAELPSLFAGAKINNTNKQLAATGYSVAANTNRRLSLRRRSSTTTNSSYIIPKFYHPNGRPNTYEIEVQKKNIVACFDKLPDKKASLTAPIYKRHFSAIAVACGFPEYIKEPLYFYIKHQLTQTNLLHNSSNAAPMVRKQSGLVAVGTNGISANLTDNQASNSASSLSKMSNLRRQSMSDSRPTLTRSATIDNSTMEKLQNQTYISCEQFLVCWRQLISTCFDNPARFVHLLTFGKSNYLLPDDFVPLVQSIIEDHPGLKFLRAAPDFHMRYIQTVIARIYFCINKSWTGKISLSELRQSNLLAVLQVLGQEDDINQITDYFSYEHFYVIYCKFWSLDQDHDLLISMEDLAKHNDAAISSRIIERIFMGIVSRHIQQTGKMSYSDFVWFLIAEEDKKHPRSIEYWFRLMDIDGDGYISMYEMEYFYYEQMKRLELMNIEALPFVDTACQILDLVNPEEKNKISLSDLKRSKMATIFFDTFINLEKYLEHESREFVSTRDCVQGGVVISDWDRYASEEYESLVAEESSV